MTATRVPIPLRFASRMEQRICNECNCHASAGKRRVGDVRTSCCGQTLVTFCEFENGPFKAKISNAEQFRVHTMLVIGGRDREGGPVSVRLHHGGPQGAKAKREVMADILASINERRAV